MRKRYFEINEIYEICKTSKYIYCMKTSASGTIDAMETRERASWPRRC